MLNIIFCNNVILTCMLFEPVLNAAYSNMFCTKDET